MNRASVRPIPSPITIWMMPFLITSPTNFPLCAPSAMRIPISLVRCVTANDITPYSPIAPRNSAVKPKIVNSLPNTG